MDTKGKKEVMVNEKRVVYGTNKDLRWMAREGLPSALATKDNVDKIMTHLEQSLKKIVQIK